MTDKLFAYLSYQDARKALDWLSAIGFSVIRTQLGDNNVVDHAELRRGQAVVMLASTDRPYQRPQLLGLSTGAGLYLLVDDVEQIYREAILFGATSVISPENTPARGLSTSKVTSGALAPMNQVRPGDSRRRVAR